MLHGTAGSLAVNHGLPEELRDYKRTLDKKGVEALLQDVGRKYPDRYRDVLQHLGEIGRRTSYLTGGYSFDLAHMGVSLAGRKAQIELRGKIQQIYQKPGLSEEEKEEQVIKLLQSKSKSLSDAVLHESLSEGNPLAYQVLSGSRGNAEQLRSLRGTDLMYEDHRRRPIPVPILHSYSQGLTPMEYLAGSFGARAGLKDTKFAVADSGFFNKQLIQAAHRLVVTGLDDAEQDPMAPARGLPVDSDDADSVGALLAMPMAGHARNTVITPKVLADIRNAGHKRLLVRSPLTGGYADGGLHARDVGVRETGSLPNSGEFVGIVASQALSEVLTQMMLGAKHKGGVAGTSKGAQGFELINQLVQVPKVFKGGAAHAQVDGRVAGIAKAPQGGHYVDVNGAQHYVGHGFTPSVKVGDVVEAGDLLSDGVPNPAEMVKHKHIGEGSRAFMHQFKKAYADSGQNANRRNIEVITRGLINHVQLSDEIGSHVPGDVVPYGLVERDWKPRKDHQVLPLSAAAGFYLEKPVLHYSIGTKLKPSVTETLKEFGVKNVAVHREPPPFEPHMVRGLENIAHDPDWMTRFIGSYLKKNFLRGVHRGDVSDERGTSYVPSLARASDFGKYSPIKAMPLPDKLPVAPVPAPSIMKQMQEAEAEKTSSWAERLSVPDIDDHVDKLKEVLPADDLQYHEDYPAGSFRQLREEDESEDDNYPIDGIIYPVACGHVRGYTNEVDEPLTLFRGDGHMNGSFVVHRPESWQIETKFYIGLSPLEHDQLMRAFAPIMAEPPEEYSSPEETQQAMLKFKRRTAL